MLDQETKKKINDLRDTLVGKVPDPKSQVEQIMIALIYKFMNDMDKESTDLGGEASFFVGDFEKYSWDNLFGTKVSGSELVDLYSTAVESMEENPNIPQLFRDIFKNAYIPYKDAETLRLFLSQIDDFEYSKDSEQLGDAFEHILNSLSSQGDAGQFRTPRHIIDFIVEIVDPKKDETVLDPASGTSGFLISAFKHIVQSNSEKSSGDLLSAAERKKIMKNINGYDISPDMVRIGLANMYLHGFPEPNVVEYDALTSEDRWSEYYDVILANPPFMTPKGGIRPHNKFGVNSNKAEVLFVDYILTHLKPKGRAGIIVPEGIIFQSSKAYKELRKKLVESGLFAVVSLPSGVFKPYSGVKTSVLFVDKSLQRDSILFSEIKNDGYSLGDQRTKIDQNDLPDTSEAIKNSKSRDIDLEILKDTVLEDHNVSLAINNYKTINIQSSFELIALNKVVQIESGKREKGGAKEKGIPSLGGEHITNDGGIDFKKEKYVSEEFFQTMKKGILHNNDVLIVKDGATTGKVGIYKNEFKKAAVNEHVFILRANENLLPEYLYYVLSSEEFQKSLKNKIQGIIQGINLKFAELLIPLPPLEKQQEIVDEIVQYQKVIDGVRQIVENFKFTYKIEDSWKEVSIGEICTFSYGKGLKASERNSGPYDVYGSNGVVDSHDSFLVEHPFIVIGRKGTAGALHFSKNNGYPIDTTFYISKDDLKIKEIEIKFLYLALKNLNLDKVSSEQTVPGLNRNDAYAKKIKLPPLDEQRKIIKLYEDQVAVLEINKILTKDQQLKIDYLISNLYN